MKQITGDDREVIESFYVKALGVRTPQQLADFVTWLDTHRQDYGTICHAMAAAAIAGASCMDHMPNADGGITGFQAGAVMWELTLQTH